MDAIFEKLMVIRGTPGTKTKTFGRTAIGLVQTGEGT